MSVEMEKTAPRDGLVTKRQKITIKRDLQKQIWWNSGKQSQVYSNQMKAEFVLKKGKSNLVEELCGILTCLYLTISLAQSGLENISEHSQCDTMVFVSGGSRAILIYKELWGSILICLETAWRSDSWHLSLFHQTWKSLKAEKQWAFLRNIVRQGIAHKHLRRMIECQKLARKVWVNSFMENSGTQKCTEEYRIINIIENS